MACVILPSETARLVYGYLVKENLNNIALQFLESSPYLTDCCQIIKSGYQFNTKIMDKDLQDLIQEYSVIHNLVNKKVSLLQKSSLLYKRIKLRCESISEILELILFWKYKNQKTDADNQKTDNSLENEKSEKEMNNHASTTDCEFTIGSDTTSKKTGNIDTEEYICFHNNTSSNFQNNENCLDENFHSKISIEISNKNIEENIENLDLSQKSEESDVQNTSSKEKNLEFTNFRLSEISENNENNVNKNNTNNNQVNSTNNSNSSISMNHKKNNCSEENEINTDSSASSYNKTNNILTIDISSQNESLLHNEIQKDSLNRKVGTMDLENQIKIIHVEKEMQNESHSLEAYNKNEGEGEENINLENSSVVFVESEVGTTGIDQERDQIIVIPIDYFKSQNNFQGTLEVNASNKEDVISEKEAMEPEKSEIIFTGVQASESCVGSIPQLYSDNINSSSTLDGNIITESDFLKNSQLMYNLEKELKNSDIKTQSQSILTTLQPLSETNDRVSIHAEPTPLIVVSQAIIPPKPQRFRTILPKHNKIRPTIVGIHPLLESNKEVQNVKSQEVKKKVKDTNVSKGVNEVNRRRKKKVMTSKVPFLNNLEKTVAENSENQSMPTIKTPISDKKENEKNSMEVEAGTIQSSSEECVKDTDAEKKNEEKENLGEIETKKTETPVFVTRRNSKRLSLSTPRRRSHIRALEFETPPKTNEEKKSKTSPKVKVEQNNVERKSVRNTLFKSPDPENNFKSPQFLRGIKKINSPTNLKAQEVLEPLNELSIPIATRSPNTKLSDAWETLTGVGCVIGQNEPSKTTNSKMWDADLRGFIVESNQEVKLSDKKRIRKPEKFKKDNRKTGKKTEGLKKKSKSIPLTVSPSKMNLTAKRNTYSINGNEEESPLRSKLEDLKLVTPFKEMETIRPIEETPLTKLLRENINTIDVDLSMINTPSFPPTPSIIITPDVDDLSAMSGTNYYSPTKDCSKDKVLKITDYFRVDTEKSKKKESKEMHEKVINELVCKAKEIIGLGENQEEGVLKRRPSGKILSMVKIQMLSQCDKKLCENIPINEENGFSSTNLNEEVGKSDLKNELEEKRKRALKKIKIIKENLSCPKRKVTTRCRKRKRSECTTKSDKSKSDGSLEVIEEKQITECNENLKESLIFHSTPYVQRKSAELEKTNLEKLNNKVLDDIRQEFPPFQDRADKYTELTEKSRKKLHYVESFLKLEEVENFLSVFNEKNPPKLFLKPSFIRFFQVFYKWLKHPHKHELNASLETRNALKEYLLLFDKINKGLHRKSIRYKKDGNSFKPRTSNSDGSHNHSGIKLQLSDDEEWKKLGNEKRKDDIEDGVVTTLPLKKRKSTVQQVEVKESVVEKDESKNKCIENVSQAQTFLQDIDLDRFLSQIHGQVNR